MPSALQRPHMLIVSDDPDLADFLGEGLVYAGFWTSAIASAMQVLEVFRLRTFDLLLLDAGLGGIGAGELLRRLRGHSDRADRSARTDIPIVVIAASWEELPPDLDHENEASAVIVAPIEIDRIAILLSQTIAEWREAHPNRPWADEAAQFSES